MPSAAYPLTEAAWVDLGATPGLIKMNDSRDVIVHTAASAPSNAVKTGVRLSYLPPHEAFLKVDFAPSSKMWARADGPEGASVTVLTA